MLPYFNQHFGNPSSNNHAFGWIAADAVQQARQQVAHLINAIEQEIIFTSGATEAINLAIKGVYNNYQLKGQHIVAIATEHLAVLNTCKALENRGAKVTYLPVTTAGEINLQMLADSIDDRTILVCAMFANNETGVILPVKEIATIVHAKKSIFMCDATQALGKIPVDVIEIGIDLLAISAHKIYGPKGVGALYVRRKNPRVSLIPQIDGGNQERSLRSGTLNVPGIVGFGKACEIAKTEMQEDAHKILSLRIKLEQALLSSANTSLNGSINNRLPNTCNISFANSNATEFIKANPKIAVTSSSACSSAFTRSSHVLHAMGKGDQQAENAIRFSLGKFTTTEEIEATIKSIKAHLLESNK